MQSKFNNVMAMVIGFNVMHLCAQEPIDISRFVYDAAIAADCVQGKAPEDACAQFIANIELMMRVGAEHQEKVQEVLNAAPASSDPRIAEIVRVKMLRGVIEKTAVAAQAEYDNRKVNLHLWATNVPAEVGGIRSLWDERQNVEDLYFKLLLQHMTSDPATYYKVKQNLRVRTWFFDDHKPLKVSQKAFFAVAEDRSSR